MRSRWAVWMGRVSNILLRKYVWDALAYFGKSGPKLHGKSTESVNNEVSTSDFPSSLWSHRVTVTSPIECVDNGSWTNCGKELMLISMSVDNSPFRCNFSTFLPHTQSGRTFRTFSALSTNHLFHLSSCSLCTLSPMAHCQSLFYWQTVPCTILPWLNLSLASLRCCQLE